MFVIPNCCITGQEFIHISQESLAREIKSSNFLLNIYHVNTKMFLGHAFCILDIKSGVVVWYFFR